jgi:hypothetical protein
MDVRTNYAVLGLRPESSLDEANEAFDARVIRLHPDRVSGQPTLIFGCTASPKGPFILDCLWCNVLPATSPGSPLRRFSACYPQTLVARVLIFPAHRIEFIICCAVVGSAGSPQRSLTIDATVDAEAEVMALNVSGLNYGSTTLNLVERNGDGKQG